MLAPPDFGRVLSHDRFVRILRYLARGPDGTEHAKEVDPWAEIRWMVDGFNTTSKKSISSRLDSYPRLVHDSMDWSFWPPNWHASHVVCAPETYSPWV